MYFELLLPLPPEDTTQFEQTVARARKPARCASVPSASSAGATRTSRPSTCGRASSRIPRQVGARPSRLWTGIAAAGLRHKDWTAEEMPTLLKSYSSEYLGANIDFGNNMSLLDDPMELIEALAHL